MKPHLSPGSKTQASSKPHTQPNTPDSDPGGSSSEFRVKVNAPQRLARRVHYETLEKRRLLSADPSVVVALPAEALIGEDFDFTVTFDNVDATDTGFGPFVDLIFPNDGADGENATETQDGIRFVGADYIGIDVEATEIVFNAANGVDAGGGSFTVDHPFAVDAMGLPLTVTGAEGDSLVVLQLPFGSYTASQPAIEVTVTANLSGLADVGTPLSIDSRAGFQYGNDAEDNPTDGDPSLTSFGGVFMSQSTTPALFTLAAGFDGSEMETVSGPNSPGLYLVSIDIADGQTLTDVDLSQLLPNNLVYTGIGAGTTAGYALTATPSVGVTGNGQALTARWASVTGTTGGPELTLVMQGYIALADADGGNVLNPTDGNNSSTSIDVSASGTWDPTDSRDDIQVVTSDVMATDSMATLRSIAVQKDVSIDVNAGSADFSPQDILEYTLDIQISDYFSFNNLVLTDVLADGLRFDATTAPTFTLTDRDGTTSGSFADPADLTVTANMDGTQTLVFELSEALITAGDDGIAIGGEVGSSAGVGATARIVYRAEIQENYAEPPLSGDPSVDQGDLLPNTVQISGDVLMAGTSTVLGTATDDSAASVTVVGPTFFKSVYAINGDAGFVGLRVSPGDTVTFRLQYQAGSNDFENLIIEDFLPLPIFDAEEFDDTDPLTVRDIVSAAAPSAGRVKFGPAHTFVDGMGDTLVVPTINVNADSNSFDLDFGTFDDPTSQGDIIDILFTTTVADEPFADGSFLTNFAQVSEQNSAGTPLTSERIALFKFTRPDLEIVKGVVAVDSDSNGSLSASLPTAFTAPGTAGARFTGTIGEILLMANVDAFDTDLSGFDADDLVTMALILRNTGEGIKGAFNVNVEDVIPTGFAAATGGLNLTVSDGLGNVLTDGVDYTGDLFAGGITLTDPSLSNGAIGPVDGTDGTNVIVLTYDLEAQTTISPGLTVMETALVNEYGGNELGINYVTVGSEPSDDAILTTTDVNVTKVLTSSSIDDANNGRTDAVIGEELTYTVTLTIPEGTSQVFEMRDTTDNGLAIVAVDSITLGSGLSASNGTGATILSNDVTIRSSGSDTYQQDRRLEIEFGTLTNSDTDDTTDETITIVYRAVVLNSDDNERGGTRNNNAQARWDLTGNTSNTDTGDGFDSAAATNVTILEPEWTVTKAADGIAADAGVVEAGDTITFRVTITEDTDSNGDAYDAAFVDTLPTGLSYVASSLTQVSGPTATAVTDTGGVMSASWSSLATGSGPMVFTYQVMVGTGLESGATIDSAGNLQWTSLPGDQTTTVTPNNPYGVERTGDGSDPVESAATNDYADSDGELLTLATPVLTKSIVSTSESATSGTDVAIGEIVRFRLEATVPQVRFSALRFVEDLPDGLLFLNDGQTTVSFVGDSDFTEPATLAGADNDAVPPSFVLPSARIEVTDQHIEFNLGLIENNDDDANTERIIVEFNALVTNESSNVNGQDLDNAFDFSASASVLASSNTVSVDVVEPDLSDFDVAITPMPTDAGDTISATITFSNDGDGPAFDVNVLEALSAANFDLNLGSVMVTLGGGATGATDNSSGDTLDIDITSIPVGGTVSITFDATLTTAVTPGLSLSIAPDLTFTSLPGAAGTTSNDTGGSTPGDSGDADGERDGSDGASGLNDYVVTDPAAFTTAVPTLTKVLTATEVVSTNNTATEAQIGELLTYTLTLDVPEGTTPSLVIADTLDAGLAFVDVISVTDSSGVSYAGDATDPTVGANGTTLTWNLGTVTNSNTNNAADESIVIVYSAIVLDESGNTRGTTLGNAATADYTGGTQLTGNAADVTVIVPELEVSQTVTVDGVQGANGDGGDTVVYTFTIEHATGSDADAFDLSILDTLPDGFTASSVAATNSTLGDQSSLVEVDGQDLQVVSGSSVDVPLGSTLTITVTGTLDTAVTPGEVLSNDISIGWSSLDGDFSSDRSTETTLDSTERADTATTSTVTTTIQRPTFDADRPSSEVVSPNNTNDEVQIGELVTFTLTIDPIEGTTADAQIQDLLDSGLAFVAVTNVDVPTGVTVSGDPSNPTVAANGTDLTFDFGTIVNSNTVDATRDPIVVTYTAVVLDEAANTAGVTLGHDATFSYTGGADQLDAGPDVTIIAPELEVSQAVTIDGVPNGTGDAGDTVVYTFTIEHAAGSDADAFDLSILDTLPDGVDVSTVVASNSVLGSQSSLFEVDGQDLQVVPGSSVEVPLGSVLTITVTGTVASDVTPGLSLSNDISVGWSSLDGDFSSDRSTESTLDSTERDGTATTTTATISTTGPSFTSELIGTELITTDNDNTETQIGELVTFRLTVNPQEGITPGAALQELLDAGLEFVEVTSVTNSSGVSITGDPANATVSSDARTIDFDLGDITNTDTNDLALDTVVIEYTARVVDVPTNVSGVTLGNDTTFTFTGGSAQMDDANDITIVEPDLSIDITVDNPAPHLGDTVTYTVVIDHTGVSDADAYNLLVDSALPPGLTLVPGSVTSTLGTVVSGGDDPQLRVGTLPTSGQVTMTYQAVVTSDPAGFGDLLTVPATVGYSSLPGDDPNERDYVAQDDTPAESTISGPDLQVTMDDGQQTRTAGESFTYTIDVTNKNLTNGDDADNVVVTLALPEGVTFDATSSQFVTSVVGNVVTFVIPSLLVGESELLEIDVVVDESVGAGVEVLPAMVSVTHSDIDPTPTDNLDEDEDLIDANPEYIVTIDDGPALIYGTNDTVVYTVDLDNAGDQDGTGVIVTATLDPLVVGNVIVSDGGTYDPSTNIVTWNVGDLDAGETDQFTITGDVMDPVVANVVDFNAVATIADDGLSGPESNLVNNTDSVLNELITEPDVYLEIDDGLSFVAPKDDVTYTVTFGNAGGQQSTGTVVEIFLDPELLIYNGDTGGGTYDPETGILTINVGDLDGRSEQMFEIDVTVVTIPSPGIDELPVTGEIFEDGSQGIDPRPENNTGEDVDDLRTFVFDGNLDPRELGGTGNPNGDVGPGGPIYGEGHWGGGGDRFRFGPYVWPVNQIYSGSGPAGGTVGLSLGGGVAGETLATSIVSPDGSWTVRMDVNFIQQQLRLDNLNEQWRSRLHGWDHGVISSTRSVMGFASIDRGLSMGSPLMDTPRNILVVQTQASSGTDQPTRITTQYAPAGQPGLFISMGMSITDVFARSAGPAQQSLGMANLQPVVLGTVGSSSGSSRPSGG